MRKNEAGQGLVEFALVIAFVFVMFVSILEMIFVMHTYSSLADSAKEGVRYAIVHGTGNSLCSGPGTVPGVSPAITCSTDPNGNNVKTAVTNYAIISMHNVTSANVTVDYNPNSVNGALCSMPGCMVRVTIAYVYQPFFGMGWPSVTVSAAADGRIMN